MWISRLLMLPGCYHDVRTFEGCRKSRLRLIRDLLTLSFSYRMLPDNYLRWRMWEIPRHDWKYYFGSNYHFPQKTRLERAVQPIEYDIVFNDKYLCALLCSSLGIRIPHTYGVIHPTENYKSRIRSWLTASSSTGLIIKPLIGSYGQGIVIALVTGNGIVIKDGPVSMSLEKYELKGSAIAQDIITQHAMMAAFSPYSVNTVRIVTMITLRGEAILVNASIRTGVGESIVDNFTAGGVSTGIDRETGTLKKYAYDKKSRRYVSHPNSGVVFENYPVPEWDRIRDWALAIQKAFSFYKLLGFDIAIDEDGQPILIEINCMPDLPGLEQKAGPLLKNEAVLKAFGEYRLLVNKHQKKLYSALPK